MPDYGYYALQSLKGLSTDTKPTGVPDNTTFLETDTFDEYIRKPGSWKLYRSAKRHQTYLVWKSGSTYYMQDITNGGLTSSTTFADMLNDEMVTLDEMGARFLFKKGTYTCEVTGTGGDTVQYCIILPQNSTGNKCNIEFMGEGWGTIFKNNDPNSKTIRDQNGATDGTYGDYFRVSDMTIDGSKANTTPLTGVTLLSSSRKSDVYFNNLHIINSGWQGMGINGEGGRATFVGYGSKRAWFSNCLIENCNGNAIDSPCEYLRIHNCASISNTLANATGMGGLDFDGSTHCEVSNFTSDADWNGVLIGGTAAGRPSQEHVFHGLVIRNARNDGFQNVGSYRTTITNFLISGCVRYGIFHDVTSYENVISTGVVNDTGTTGSGGGGIVINNSLKPLISNVQVKTTTNSAANGIYIAGGSHNAIINGCNIQSVANAGIAIQGSTDAIISNCRIQNCSNLDGISISGSAHRPQISNCIISSARHGITVTGSTDPRIIGVTSRNNNRAGFNMFGAIRGVFIGCVATDNSISPTNSYDGYIMDGDGGSNGPTDSCILIGCKGYDSRTAGSKTQRNGISLTSFANSNVIAFCDFNENKTAAVSNSGTSNNFRFTKGYVTEASGTSTQNGDGSTKVFNIAHGLAAAPTKIMAAAGHADSVGPFYVTADATNVIVTYPTAPQTGTSNVVLRWIGEF